MNFPNCRVSLSLFIVSTARVLPLAPLRIPPNVSPTFEKFIPNLSSTDQTGSSPKPPSVPTPKKWKTGIRTNCTYYEHTYPRPNINHEFPNNEDIHDPHSIEVQVEDDVDVYGWVIFIDQWPSEKYGTPIEGTPTHPGRHRGWALEEQLESELRDFPESWLFRPAHRQMEQGWEYIALFTTLRDPPNTPPASNNRRGRVANILTTWTGHPLTEGTCVPLF